MSGKAFIDSNVLLYLLAADPNKADRAETVIAGNSVISVQVLNEVANVARKKLDMSWAAIGEFLGLVRSICPVEPLTVETHDRALQLTQRYRLSLYDASIVAAALMAQCAKLYSEDLQHGMLFDGALRVVNPFKT